MKVSMNKFEKAFNNKLRVLKNANPKEYWKLLCTNDTKVASKIHIDVLSEYFKKLNNDENIYDEHDKKFDDVNADEWSVNKYINEDFCESEIRKIVIDLKNNKSQGVDQILNEFIKSTIDLLCSTYVTLFNLILRTGYSPDKWAIGIIIPIYKNKGPMDDPSNYRGITLYKAA